MLWYCDLVGIEKNYGKGIRQEFKDNLNPEDILNNKIKDSKNLYFISAISMNIGNMDGIYQKFFYILGCIFPKRISLIHQYDIKNPNFVYIYYISRPFIAFYRILKSFMLTIKQFTFYV